MECHDDKAECEVLRFDMSLRRGSPSAVWPISIHMHGTLGEKRIDRTFRLNFDTVSGTYPVPYRLSHWD